MRFNVFEMSCESVSRIRGVVCRIWMLFMCGLSTTCTVHHSQHRTRQCPELAWSLVAHWLIGSAECSHRPPMTTRCLMKVSCSLRPCQPCCVFAYVTVNSWNQGFREISDEFMKWLDWRIRIRVSGQ